jgi:plasmid stability protein
MIRTITVTLPEDLYEQLEARARTAARSVEDVVTQTLARSLPPTAEPNLPPAVQAELNAMEQLSDEALWTIARSTANDDKVALYDLLVERQDAGMLTPEGRSLLTQLRDAADALMLRKAHAYALLQSRGYTLPTLDELHAQIP